MSPKVQETLDIGMKLIEDRENKNNNLPLERKKFRRLETTENSTNNFIGERTEPEYQQLYSRYISSLKNVLQKKEELNRRMNEVLDRKNNNSPKQK